MIIDPPRKRPNNPEGWYPAILDSVEFIPDVIYFDEMKDVVDIGFKLPYDGYITQRYNYSFYHKSNLYRVIVNVTGHKPDYDVGLDTEELIGEKCLIRIEHNEDSKGNVWENVREVKLFQEGMLKGEF